MAKYLIGAVALFFSQFGFAADNTCTYVYRCADRSTLLIQNGVCAAGTSCNAFSNERGLAEFREQCRDTNNEIVNFKPCEPIDQE